MTLLLDTLLWLSTMEPASIHLYHDGPAGSGTDGINTLD